MAPAGENHHSGISWKTVARIIDSRWKNNGPLTPARNRCGHQPLDADDYFNGVCKGDMFSSQLVGPTLGRVATWMHGVAPHMCNQVVHPLLDQGAGGRSPGFLLLVMALDDPA
jgi:hypothetical protein